MRGNWNWQRLGNSSGSRMAVTQDEPEISDDAFMYQGKLPLSAKFSIALQQFRKWVVTPFGIFTTIYMLNVVAWGGMLFLLLCNASPAMCHPTCNNIDSPRRKWIEVDSQILNALFCVTGFGLAPWRFRDLYWWAVWRFSRSEENRSCGIRRLAGIHKDWYRLPCRSASSNATPVQRTQSENSELLAQGDVHQDPAMKVAVGADPSPASETNCSLPKEQENPAEDGMPIPASKAPKPPLTGIRAPATAPWKMTFVVHCMVWNTLWQACLSGCMWGMNRYKRPSWTTGLFLSLAFTMVALAGWVMMKESGRIKKIEGKQMSSEEKQARVQIAVRQMQETQQMQIP